MGRYRRKDVELIRSLLKYLDREYTGWIVPPKVKKKPSKARRKRRSKIG